MAVMCNTKLLHLVTKIVDKLEVTKKGEGKRLGGWRKKKKRYAEGKVKGLERQELKERKGKKKGEKKKRGRKKEGKDKKRVGKKWKVREGKKRWTRLKKVFAIWSLLYGFLTFKGFLIPKPSL